MYAIRSYYEVIGQLDAADGILLGSPTYFANVSTELKAVIDRAGMVAKSYNFV